MREKGFIFVLRGFLGTHGLFGARAPSPPPGSSTYTSNLSFFLPYALTDILEGLDGGSGIHYSLKIKPIIHLIKIWVIH